MTRPRRAKQHPGIAAVIITEILITALLAGVLAGELLARSANV